MADTSMYIYKPLLFENSIRLLILKPSSDPASDLTGSLLHTTIKECDNDLIEGYTALSYVWGNPDKTGVILIEGRACYITANLEAALRDIRNGSKPHRLWADALCINQDDEPERNKQVGLMGLIYSNARNTIIYLGALTSNAESLLNTASSENEGYGNENVARMRKCADEDLLHRDWFTRVWIFQELVLSKDPWVQCGRLRARWSSLCAMLLSQKAKDSKNQEFDFPQWQMLEVMQKARGAVKPCLDKCLEVRRGFGATLDQDMVYAQLGVANDASLFMERFPVAYTKTWREVFTDAAIHIFQQQGIYRLLSHHPSMRYSELEGNKFLSLACPSWVPDWTSKYPYKGSINRSLRASFDYYDYDTRADYLKINDYFRMHPSRAMIVCKVRLMDKIKAISDAVPTAPNIDLASWDELERHATRPSSRVRKDPASFFWKWLQMLQSIYPHWNSTSDEVDRSSALLLQSMEEWTQWRSTREEFTRDVLPIIYFMLEYMDPDKNTSALEGRRFAVTVNGCIGVVAAEARIGDVVFGATAQAQATITQPH